MKRKFLIFIFNLLTIIGILFIIEGIIWQQENQNLRNIGDIKPADRNLPFHAGISKFNLNLNEFPTGKYNAGRLPEGLEYSKKPIVIFGCSYAFGYNLENNETLSYKLSHQAKVPVYNRAYSGWGIQHMLYQVKNELFYKKVPEPQYAIYIYIPDHINRLYYNSFLSYDTICEKFNLRYKEENGTLKEIPHNNLILNQFQRLYLINKINQHLIINSIKTKKDYDFALKHFVEAKKEMGKHWENTKYVVLFYTSSQNENYLKNRLKENDFIVIDADEITNKNLCDNKYMRKDFHPNEEAWNVVIPELIKKLGV